MSLNLEEKKAVVAEVSEKLAQAQAVVLAEYRGLAVEEMTQLRVNARDNGVYLRVLKNTLARRAVTGPPFACLWYFARPGSSREGTQRVCKG